MEGVAQNLTYDILQLLAVAVLATAFLRRVGLPPIVSYLVVGMVVGPHGLGWLVHAGEIHFMAELGVMFLMFLLGLEFSLPALVAARGLVFGVGGAQVSLTVALAAGAGIALGLPVTEAVMLGGAIAMSSTALTVRQLTQQLELNTRHGRMAVGTLLFQDLATLPFLAVIPVLGGVDGDWHAVPLALLKAAAVFVAIVAVGRWAATPFLSWASDARTPDVLVLATLLLILSAGTGAAAVGLSLPLGAFMAGMVIGETHFRHQVEAEIRPFQDILLGLFFVMVGMQFEPAVLRDHTLAVLGLAAAVMALKLVTVTAAGALFRMHLGVGFRAGLVLAHCGEFSLLLITLGSEAGVVRPLTGQITLAAVIITMFIAPLLIRWNGALGKRLDLAGYANTLTRQEDRIAKATESLEGHVILCGYGRVGQSVARFLELEGLPYVALELDLEVVKSARAAGEPVLYGDVARESLLAAAGLENAGAMVVTFDNPDLALKVLACASRCAPELPVVVRTTDLRAMERLSQAGATAVIPETLEASVMLGVQVLSLLDVPQPRLEALAEAVRESGYRRLRGLFKGAGPVRDGAPGAALRTLHLSGHVAAVGSTIHELHMEALGVSLVAVRRGSMRIPEPTPELRLRAGDVLVMYGSREALARAENRLLGMRGG